MILFLDTTDLNKIRFALILQTGKKVAVKSKTVKIPYEHSHKTLELLAEFLKTNDYKLTTNDSIMICSGPGSFTGLRVGVSLAQALGFAWNIPVRAIKSDKVPKNLKDLTTFRGGKKLTLDYGRPAI